MHAPSCVLQSSPARCVECSVAACVYTRVSWNIVMRHVKAVKRVVNTVMRIWWNTRSAQASRLAELRQLSFCPAQPLLRLDNRSIDSVFYNILLVGEELGGGGGGGGGGV